MSVFVPTSTFERITVAAVLVALVILAVLFGVARGDGQVLIGLGFALFVTVLLIPLLGSEGRAGWFHPLVFYVIWSSLLFYVTPRLGVLVNGLEYHVLMRGLSQTQRNEISALGFLLVTVGLIGLLIGFRMSRPTLRVLELRRQPERLLPKVLVVFAVSMAALLMLIAQAGSFDALLLQRGLPSDQRIGAEIGRHLHFLVMLATPACLLWLALVPTIWRSPVFIALFLGALAMAFAATGSRSAVVVPILMAGALWCLNAQRIPYVGVVATFLLALFVIQTGGEFREQSRFASTTEQIELSTTTMERISLGFSSLTQRGVGFSGYYGILDRVPKDVGYLYGYSYLSIPFAPIPAAILPFDKPQAGGKLTSTHIFNNPLSGVPPSPVGEAYWNFGVPGIFLVFLLYGRILRFVGSLYENSSENGIARALYVFTLFSLSPSSNAFYDWLHMVVPAILIAGFFCGLPRLATGRAAAPVPA